MAVDDDPKSGPDGDYPWDNNGFVENKSYPMTWSNAMSLSSNPYSDLKQSFFYKLHKSLKSLLYWGKVSKLLTSEYIQDVYGMFPDLDNWSSAKTTPETIDYSLGAIIDLIWQTTCHMGAEEYLNKDFIQAFPCEFTPIPEKKEDAISPAKNKFDLLDI